MSQKLNKKTVRVQCKNVKIRNKTRTSTLTAASSTGPLAPAKGTRKEKETRVQEL